MPTERTGLLPRGTLLKASAREVRPKDADAFTVYEARVLADDTVLVVTFYDADEMEGALRSCRPGTVVELPVYGRASNKRVFLHYRRDALVVDTPALDVEKRPDGTWVGYHVRHRGPRLS